MPAPRTALVSSAEEVIKISSQLEAVLAEYDPAVIRSCCNKMKKSLRYHFSGRQTVEGLHNRLKEIIRQLETSVLVDLRKQIKKLDHETLAALDQHIRKIARFPDEGILNWLSLH